MTGDGRQLEALVAFVEKTLLPRGFEVRSNKRVLNDNGVQIAEFDIEIRGKVGSTQIAWLIECRDRPADGPSPASWIEQLVGRRTRFGFNKITAVSTAGFSRGAIEFADAQGIELREVADLTPASFAWLQVSNLHHVDRVSGLREATFFVGDNEGRKRRRAFARLMEKMPANAAFLRSIKTGGMTTAANAFSAAVRAVGNLFDDVRANGPSKPIELEVVYENDDDHFVIDTKTGPIRIRAITFAGELRITETLVPLARTAEYRHTKSGEPISQLVAFAPQQAGSLRFAMEMHRIAETKRTHIVLRQLPEEGKKD